MINRIVQAFHRELDDDNVENLVNTEEYQKYGFSIVDCPICGRKTLDMFWVCFIKFYTVQILCFFCI